MKHARVILPLLLLALLLTACGSNGPYQIATSHGIMTVDPEAGTITAGGNVYTYTLDGSSTVLTYPDGTVYTRTATSFGSQSGWSGSYDRSRYLSPDILLQTLEQEQPREKIGGPVVAIPILLLGLLNTAAPELQFYLQRGWLFRDVKPSDGALRYFRVCGVITAVFGLILFFI